MKKRILPLLAALIALSCARDIDFDMINDIEFSPSATVPLVNARLSLEDLVNEQDSLLLVDPDDALRIYYREDSIFTYGVDDLLEIPPQDPQSLELDENNSFIGLGYGFGTIAGAEIDSIAFNRGFLQMQIEATVDTNLPLEFELKVNNAYRTDGSTFSTVFTLSAGNTFVLDSTTLKDVVFDLTDGGTQINYLNVELSIKNPQRIPNGGKYNCTFTLTNLEVDRALGFFSQRFENIPPGSFDLPLAGLENFGGGFYLTNPQVSLIARASVGLPIEIVTDIDGVNTFGEVVALNAEPFRIVPASAPGQTATSNLSVNRNNSDVVDFLANIPQQILYSGSGELNPDGRPATPNFISRESEVSVDFEVNVPLEFRIEDMRLDETIEDFSISQENPEALEKFIAFFKIENGFPLNLDLRVSFLDGLSGDSLGGVAINLLSAAPVNADGRVTEPRISNEAIEFDNEQIDALLAAGALRIQAFVSTTNNGLDEVKIYNDYGLKVQMATEVRLNIKPDSQL